MSKRLFRLLVIICLLSVAGQIFLYPRLPEVVPIHWDYWGKIDGWGRKFTNLIMAALPLVMLIGFRILPLLDPRRKNYQKHQKAYGIFATALIVMLVLFSWAVTVRALGIPLPVSSIVGILVGLLLVVQGNYMPQVRSNFFFGFRTPWALSDDMIWRKTNKAGGVIYCVCGVLLIVGAFVPGTPWALLPIFLLLAGIAGVWVYSYYIFRKKQRSK